MNYDVRMGICKRIRVLEYDRGGEANLRNDIESSTEFNKDEKNSLSFCMNRFSSRNNSPQSFPEAMQRYFPYLVAGAGGYAIRALQEKINDYLEEGKKKAREDFFTEKNSSRTSS